MYHGLSAYNRTRSIHELINRINSLGCVCACYADRPIGPIGVYTPIEHAKVEYIADRDVYSKSTGTGRDIERTSYTDDAFIIYPDKGDDLYNLLAEMSRRADQVDNRMKKYAEIGAVAEPAAIWVNPKYGPFWKKTARVLSRVFNLSIITI